MKNKILKFNFENAKKYFESKLNLEISVVDLKNIISSDIEDINIVDVRKYDDYIDGHIPFAIHVPYDSYNEHLVMFEKNKINILYTYNITCTLAEKIALDLIEHKYPAIIVLGGFQAWKELQFDIVKND